MPNPDPMILLSRALEICSSVANLEVGPDNVQGKARELMELLTRFTPFVPEPGTQCRCGRGAVRLRNGQAFCYSCWMGMPQRGQEASGGSTMAIDSGRTNTGTAIVELTRRLGRRSNIA
jgi:hypothetical protein